MCPNKHAGLPRFIAAVLTDDARQRLELAIGDFKFPNSKLKEEQHLHHVTMAFNPTLSDYQKIIKTAKSGDEVIVKCKKRCWSKDYGAEAVKVELLNKDGKPIYVQSGFPHITVSTDGKPPVAGMKLFAQSDEGYDGENYIHDLECEGFDHITLSAIVTFKD
jgi:hypothetical protein